MLTLLFLPLVVAAAVIASAKAGWKPTRAYGGAASLAFGIVGATLLEAPMAPFHRGRWAFFWAGCPESECWRAWASSGFGFGLASSHKSDCRPLPAHFPAVCGKI